MTLDVRTIVVMLILTSVLMAATFAVGIRGRRANGFGNWNLGLGLYALGWLLVAARGTLPDFLAMAGSNALLFAGLCLQLVAVIQFGGKRAPAALLFVPGPLLFVVTLPLMANYTAFTVTASAAVCVALSVIAVQAVRLGTAGGGARYMLAVTYALAALGLIARGTTMELDPAAYPGLFSQSVVHAVAFVLLFAATCAGSTAFLLMLRRLSESEIRHLATFDPLTDVFNRRAFMELAERELSRARRTGSAFSVLMMDLDHFKRVNDSFGHQAGDRVVAEFATTTKRCLRSEDLIGRYGGEEFCAMLPGADLPKSLEIAERVRAEIARRPLANLPQAMTVSIGLAACDPSQTLDEAIGTADEALYRAKRNGRNCVVGQQLGNRVSARI